MNILFLVHIDEAYRHRFPDNFRKDLKQVMEQKTFEGIAFDRIVVLDSKDYINEGIVKEAEPHVKKIITWGFRYHIDRINPNAKKYLIHVGGRFQTYTWIPPYFRNSKTIEKLKAAKIYIGGGCRTDCVDVFQKLLAYLGLQGERLPPLLFD